MTFRKLGSTNGPKGLSRLFGNARSLSKTTNPGGKSKLNTPGFDGRSSFTPSKRVKLPSGTRLTNNLPQSGSGSLADRAQGGNRYGWFTRNDGTIIRIDYGPKGFKTK